MRSIRKSYAGTALVLAVGIGLAGCSSPGGQAEASDPTPSQSTTATDSAFPVTIASALGDAEIPSKPERVVTIGWGASDAAVALGTIPVGVEEVTWGEDEHGNYPWLSEAIQKAGGEYPQTFTGGQDIDVAAIADLAPDVILAPLSGLTQSDFDLLSAVAPTVAYPDKPWQTPWQDLIQTVGKALGEEDAAADEISTIKTTVTERGAEYPAFAGKSFAYFYAGGAPGSLNFYQPGDARVDLISMLGFEEDPKVAALPLTEGAFASQVGLENADLLADTQLLLTWFNSEEEQATVSAQPLYQEIPAIKNGALVVNLDRQLGMASSMLTPLSVPWALDRYLPMLDEAVGKIPAQ